MLITESTEALVREVFDVLKEDSRKGDFVNQINIDLEELDIDVNNEEIGDISKYSWKKYLKEKTDTAAFNFLLKDNESKDRTKNTKFYEFRMSDYLDENKNTNIKQIIFSTRSQTLDIKVWRPWKYSDDVCVKCQLHQETMDHFMTCVEYGEQINCN